MSSFHPSNLGREPEKFTGSRVYLLTYCAKFLSSPDHRPDAVYRTTEKLIGALELQKRHDETILLVPLSVLNYPKIVSLKNVNFQYP